MIATLRLWFVSTVLAAAVMPLVARLCPGLGDRGAAVARPAGMLLLGLAAWGSTALGVGSLLPAWLLVIAVGGILPLIGQPGRRLRRTLGRIGPRLVMLEVGFAIACALYAFLASYNPAIDPDSERFVDAAMLASMLGQPAVPAIDPWLAGEPLNYYHFGYWLLAVLGRSAGLDLPRLLVPALALIWATALTAAFGLGWNLARHRLAGGLLAVFLICAAGNLEPVASALAGEAPDWFRASRVIEGTINEFPAFSFLWGDPHPYVIGLPFCLLYLTLLAAWWPARPAGARASWRLVAERTAAAAVAGAALLAINAWDFPIYSGVGLVLAVAFAGSPRRLGVAAWLRATAPGWLAPLLGLALARAVLLPGLDQAGREIGLVGERSAPGPLLLIFGLFALLLLLRLAGEPSGGEPAASLALFGLGCGAVLAAVSGPALLAVLLAIAALLLARRWADRRERFALLLVACAMAMALLCEAVFLEDFYGADLERMNTVFKVYFQLWVLLGLAGSVLVLQTLASASRQPRRPALALAVGLVLALGAVYPLAAVWQRTVGFGGPRGFDADQALARELPDDHRLIEWLRANANGAPVILEATGEPYTWFGRVSTFTGLPAVLGWGHHEAGWNNSWTMSQQRSKAVHELYTTTDERQRRSLLERFAVRFVVVGDLERRRYPGPGLARLEASLEEVFRAGEARLYRVPERAGVGARP